MSTEMSYVIGVLENVQRSFTRRFFVMKELNYWVILKELKISSPKMRRERYCITIALKILHKLVANLSCDENQNNTDDMRGLMCTIPSLIRREAPRLNVNRDFNYGIQGPKTSNCFQKKLCDRGDTDDPKLLNKFKIKLKTFMATVPDETRLSNFPIARQDNSITT